MATGKDITSTLIPVIRSGKVDRGVIKERNCNANRLSLEERIRKHRRYQEYTAVRTIEKVNSGHITEDQKVQNHPRTSPPRARPRESGTPECSQCGMIKAPSDFFIQSGGSSKRCKDCYRDYARRIMYGLSKEEYRNMLELQKGRCAICNREPRAATSGRSRAILFIDHDHATGRVRGLLCNGCNAGIGHLQDDPKRLRAAVKYLKRGKQDDTLKIKDSSGQIELPMFSID